MAPTEIPERDTEAGQPISNGTTAAAPECAKDAKVGKATCLDRVWIGILLGVVAVVAIAGITVTLVLERQKADMPKYDDDNYNNSNDNQGSSILQEYPFVISPSSETGPYASVEDLRQDMEALVKTFANTVILEQASRNHNNYHLAISESMPDALAMTEAAPSSSSEKAASSSSESFEGVSDFETYQHEAGVVKDDLVKSNGEFVFAGVNNRIEIWDVEGEITNSWTMRTEDNSDISDSYNINALVMNPEGNRLVVIGTDYNRYTKSVVNDFGQTQVILFGIEGSVLTEISKTYIDGYHMNSYSVGSNVHVVTDTSFDLWSIIDDPLYRYNFDYDLTDEEYVAEATRKAEEIMPKFVDQVMEYVTEGDEILVSRMVGFRDSVNDYKSIVQISSFDMNNSDGLELSVSKSLAFTPGNSKYVYATDDWIWVSDLNRVWGMSRQDHVEQTMLLGFQLNGASTNFAAVGSLPGQLLSQFSIDFTREGNNEYIRVATTQRFETNWWGPRPFPMPEPIFVEEGGTQSPSSSLSSTTSSTRIGSRSLSSVFVGDDRVFRDDDIDERESRTLNEVIILSVPTSQGGLEINELVRLGSVELGKKDESITAVRFFDNLSYVVTFERTDPFYVLDLSDPMEPKILGELEIPGFSEFMHPITDDNSMLITIGKDADERGMVTGFQISIFDSTVPTDPKLVDRLVIGGGSTRSSASWDERAFRYIQVGDVGRLIIPLYSYTWDGESSESFDGFTVFGVDLSKTESMITREIDINHEAETGFDERSCWCDYVWLPQRSFVFDGNLMTMKSASVVSTDLVSHETNWFMSFENKSPDCCP